MPSIHSDDPTQFLPTGPVHFSAYRQSQFGFSTPGSTGDPDQKPSAFASGCKLLAETYKVGTTLQDSMLHFAKSEFKSSVGSIVRGRQVKSKVQRGIFREKMIGDDVTGW